MAKLTFDIPDAKMQDFLDAWGFGWTATLPNGDPNPETQQQFARKQIIYQLKSRVKQHQANSIPELDIT